MDYLPILVFGLFGLAFPWWLRHLKAFIIGNTLYGGERGELLANGGQFFKVYFTAGLIISAAGAVGGIAGVMIVKGGLSTAAIVMIAAPFYAGYIFAFAYIKANITNLVWNNCPIGPIRFRSTLEAFGLAKLYIANAVAIIASLGMLTPWAVIRTFKYRARHIEVMAIGPLTDFRGSDTSAVQAAGAEVAEFFDLDLSV